MQTNPLDVYKSIGSFLNSITQQYNFRVAEKFPAGKKASDGTSSREYRLQLINVQNDTSESIKEKLPELLKKEKNIKSIKYNELSPNSSKYSSVSFKYDGLPIDVVIAKGANKGESFEKKVVSDLEKAFSGSGISDEYKVLLDQLRSSNKNFAKNEIKRVSQRSGGTRKEGIPLEKLNEIIGDIVLEDSKQNKWYISLKDVNGDTFSSYTGGATLMSASGDLNGKSIGADFLRSFGVDLNLVQAGFDSRSSTKKKPIRKSIPVTKPNSTEMKKILERAWGVNYFYVRKMGGGKWKAFWIGRSELDKLTNNIKVTEIRYPDKLSKQIAIFCENNYAKYLIEVRNSKGGEYPNDIKFKAKKINL